MASNQNIDGDRIVIANAGPGAIVNAAEALTLAVRGTLETPAMGEILFFINRFLNDHETLKKSYDPTEGYVVLTVEDPAATDGIMDAVVADLQRQGYVCRWKNRYRFIDSTEPESSRPVRHMRQILFAIPA